MDHRYIDDFSVPERYLHHTLHPEEREAFEAHFIACQECIDRLLLAEMFEEPLPRRARFAAQFRPWQWVLIFLIAATLLLAIPTAFFLWELSRLNGRS